MTTGTDRVRPSVFMLALGGITLVLGSWGLYDLAVLAAGVPHVLAVLTVTGFDLFAIAVAKHALTVAEDGDSSGPWNLLVVAVAAFAAFLQYAHMQLTGRPWQVGLMMGMFPAATVVLFEGTLRRAHRLNGRRDGRVAKPRATFELMMWAIYPRATWRAFRLAVADRDLGADGAFKLGLLASRPERIPPVERRTVEIGYTDTLGPDARVLSAVPPDIPSDVRPDVPAVVRPVSTLEQVSTSDIVRDGFQRHGDDPAAVLEYVRRFVPEAREDSVRRTLRRIRGNGEAASG